MSSSPSGTSSPTSSMNALPPRPSRSPKTRKVIIGVVALFCFGLVATIGTLGHQSSITFRACFGALLCLLGCILLHVSVALFKCRQTTLLELSQPLGLSLFALSGAIATFGSFTLALPEYDAACAVRQPIILTCLSLMGSITVARVWRIGCLMSPAISFASSSSDKVHVDKVQLARTKILSVLSKISGWMLVVGSCRRYRSVGVTTNTLRKQVTLADSMRVVAVLMMPQVLLQVINLSVSSIRMQSVEVYDDIYACQSSTGPLFLILGIVLAVAPFFAALLLNVKSEGMHEVFREFNQLLTCGKICIGVLVITLPTVGMIAHIIPNAHAYLLAASLLSFLLPLCYQIAWLRLHATRRGKAKRTRDVLKNPNSSSVTAANGDDLETIQMAEEASASSKMFQTMGNLKKAVEINNDILTMFKKEEDYACDVGFTSAEVNSFGPKTLKMVVSTLITNAKHSNLGEESTALQKASIKSAQDAMAIFERAPAKASVEDRSFVFPGYSFIDAMINMGIFGDTDLPIADLENDCASNFVKETQFQVYHYCRALAMKAVSLAKLLKFDEAFAVLDHMKSLYDPALHTKAISDSYGTDWCASMIASSALWHQHLNQTEKALGVCEEVIRHILPEVAKTNVNNSNILGLNYVVFPVIQVLRSNGQHGSNRAHEIYNSQVVESFNARGNRSSMGNSFVPPMRMILTCCSVGVDYYNIPIKYNGMEDDVEWVLNGESKVVDEFENYIINQFSLSISCLLAEVCLQLAKRVEIGSQKQRDLIEEGCRYSALTESKVKDKDGKITNHIVCEFYTRVYSELCMERESV